MEIQSVHVIGNQVYPPLTDTLRFSLGDTSVFNDQTLVLYGIFALP